MNESFVYAPFLRTEYGIISDLSKAKCSSGQVTHSRSDNHCIWLCLLWVGRGRANGEERGEVSVIRSENDPFPSGDLNCESIFDRRVESVLKDEKEVWQLQRPGLPFWVLVVECFLCVDLSDGPWESDEKSP
jgi:hypothetical protein